MPNRFTWALGAAALIGLAAPAWAHHSFDAEFDRNQVVTLHGKVTKMEWVNPHAMIHVEVVNEDGTTSSWMIEGNTPNSLLRAGLTKESLKPGSELIVRGFRAKSGENFASASEMLFKDGKQFAMGGEQGTVLGWISSDEELWKRQIEILKKNAEGVKAATSGAPE